MKPTPFLILTALAACCIVCAGCVQSAGTDGDARAAMLLTLNSLQGDVNGALTAIDRSAETVAGNLTDIGLAGPEVDALLLNAVATDPSIHTAAVIARNGTVVAVQPEVEGLVGTNLLAQPVVHEVMTGNVPVMSDLFTLREGGSAATIEYPIFSSGGQAIGAVSITFRPDLLVGAHAEAAIAGTPYAVMATQPDGLILYDADGSEIGTNTFNETMYADFPEVLDIARRQKAEWSGLAAYSFYGTGSETVVKKEICWTTAGLHGTEWRLSLVREIAA